MSITKKIFSAIFIVVITFLILFIAEISVRFYNSRVKNICPEYFNLNFYPYYKISSILGLVYEMNPSIVMPDDKERGDNIFTNSLGFRDREYSLSKPKDVFRIVGIGDSICYGENVEFDKRFLKLIEKWLNKSSRSKNNKYEVINCAVPGYNLTQYYLDLKEKALKYNPDLVICSLWIDDLQPPYIPSFINRSIIKRIHHYLIDHSYLWRFLFYKLFAERLYSSNLMKINLETNLNSLDKMIKLAKNNDIKILFILQSTLLPDYDGDDFYGEIKSILNQKDIPWIEMHPFYLKYLGKRDLGALANAPGGSHPNIEGNKVIARILFEYLMNSNLLID